MYRQYLSSQNTGRTVTTIEVVASSDFLGKTEREGNLTLPVGSCDMWEVFLGSSAPQDNHDTRATMTYDRLFGLAMIHVHRNNTVGEVNPEAVLKIHLALTNYEILSFEFIH